MLDVFLVAAVFGFTARWFARHAKRRWVVIAWGFALAVISAVVAAIVTNGAPLVFQEIMVGGALGVAIGALSVRRRWQKAEHDGRPDA